MSAYPIQQQNDTHDEVAARRAMEATAKMSGPTKAAVLCLMLGDDAIAEVLKHLNDDEVRTVFRELTALKRVSPEIGNCVVKEFHEMVSAGEFHTPAGAEFAQRLLIKSFGPDAARRFSETVTRSVEAGASIETIRKASPQNLAKLLQSEHPQTAALVLAHLDPPAAAATLSHLPEEQRSSLIMRLADLQSVSHGVVGRVLMAIDQKLKSMGVTNQQLGGVETAAELCNRLDRFVARKALDEIQTVNPNLALSIRGLMVTFDDLLLVDEIAIREILKRTDKSVIAMALKGASQDIQARFYSNMSTKAAEQMKEDMEYLGQVKVRDVSAAQLEIVGVLTELDEQGVISLSGSSDGDDGYIS